MKLRLNEQEKKSVRNFGEALFADGYAVNTVAVYGTHIRTVMKAGTVAAAIESTATTSHSALERAVRLYDSWVETGAFAVERRSTERRRRQYKRQVSPFEAWLIEDDGKAESTARNYASILDQIRSATGQADPACSLAFPAALKQDKAKLYVTRTKHADSVWALYTQFRKSQGLQTLPLFIEAGLPEMHVMAIYVIANIFDITPKMFRNMKRERYRYKDEPAGAGVWYNPKARHEDFAKGSMSWAFSVWLSDGIESGPLIAIDGVSLTIKQIAAELARVHDIVGKHGESNGYHWLPQRWWEDWRRAGYPMPNHLASQQQGG
jgi:hypothetical protein